jgi:hypothetical protein
MTSIEANMDNMNITIQSELSEVKPSVEVSEFSRSSIEALGEVIRLSDKDEINGLDMFCYIKCSQTDSDVVKNCRGVVFNGDKIVMKAFPYTIEYHCDDTENITKLFDKNDFSKCVFYEAHEGALIRMFYYSGKWYTCTHRKLDAFKSKWASKESFGSSFLKALEVEIETNKALKSVIPSGDEDLLTRFQKTLDETKQYMFLVRNTSENRIVCNPPSRATVYHVGTFVDGTLSMTENIHVPYPTMLKFGDVENLLSYVDKVNCKDLQGVIVFAPDNSQYKILNSDYYDFFKTRGNEPSIKYRYLQIRMDSKQSNMLYSLYPEMADAFDRYEDVLYDKAREIYNSYVSRFIKKQYTKLPKEEYIVMSQCHEWHVQDREKNKINLNKVIDILNTQSPRNLNHMIKAKEYADKKELTKTDDPSTTDVEIAPVVNKKRPRILPKFDKTSA